MKSQKRVNVPTAVKTYSNIMSDPTHSTTANFMEFGVARAKELCKNQTYEFDMHTTVRLKPMSQPTYGNVMVHNRAFFVPFRLVMPGFNDFDNDTPYFYSGLPLKISNVHRISNSVFVSMFVSPDFSNAVAESDIESVLAKKSYDFIRYDSGTSPKPYRFTTLGRYAYKILRSLGYGIYLNGGTSLTTNNNMYHSALPLLCWMRIYFDWYFPSMYVDDNRANELRRWFDVIPTTANSFGITSDQLAGIFRELRRVSYDTDFFTAAWDNPAAPNNGSFSAFSIADPTIPANGSVVRNYSTGAIGNGTPSIGATSSSNPANLSQFSLDVLKSLTDYMKRNQIAGARTIDRFMARWGSAPISEKIARTQYVGEHLFPIRIGDVTSTANSDGTPLGGYAGKGFGSDGKQSFVNYTCEERGMLIVISTIVPEPVYYQGALRHTMHFNMLDFYNPEFDNIGVQTLSTREVYIPNGVQSPSDYSPASIDFNNAVFGFVPRYADYKIEHSQITGDLVLGSKNVGMEGWTFGRDLSTYFDGEAYADVSHSQEFVDGSDAQQYDRIFDYFGDDEDKFIVEHRFNINNRFPGSKLYDGYEYSSQGKAPNVSIDLNGVRAN